MLHERAVSYRLLQVHRRQFSPFAACVAGVADAFGPCVLRDTAAFEVRQVARVTHQFAEQFRVAIFHQFNDADPGPTPARECRRIETQNSDDALCVVIQADETSIGIDSDVFDREHVTGVRQKLLTLSQIARMAGVKQVVVIGGLIGIPALRGEMIQIEFARYAAPLLADQTEHATE